VRVGLSPYMGYIVAIAEALDYISFAAFGVTALARMILKASTGQVNSPYTPVLWLTIYSVFLTSMLKGGKHSLWNATLLLTVVAIAIKLLFCFISIPQFDYDHYNTTNSVDGLPFLKIMPLCAAFFSGVEICSQLCGDVEKVGFYFILLL
jgi:amino acid transporter